MDPKCMTRIWPFLSLYYLLLNDVIILLQCNIGFHSVTVDNCRVKIHTITTWQSHNKTGRKISSVAFTAIFTSQQSYQTRRILISKPQEAVNDVRTLLCHCIVRCASAYVLGLLPNASLGHQDSTQKSVKNARPEKGTKNILL